MLQMSHHGYAMLACQSEHNHKIDITGSGSFTFDYYNSVPYETTPSDPKLTLHSLIVSLFTRMGKQNVIHYPGDTIIAF